MKRLTKILQNPFIKLFASPLAFILFGSVLGAQLIGEFKLQTFILLYLIVTILEIIDHFLKVKLDLKKTQKTSNSILYLLEIGLLALYITFAFSQHWIINVLLFLALAANHLLYYPYKFTTSVYHLLLNTFFKGGIWQIIAYFSQSSGLHTEFLPLIIPLILMNLALEIEIISLLKQQIGAKPFLDKKIKQSIILISAILAIGLAIYYSKFSQTFYILEIIFVLVNSFNLIPIFIQSQQEHQIQNKTNYLFTYQLIFSILYTLIYLY